MKTYERFLNYVAYPTMSDDASETVPSSAKQLVLANEAIKQGLSVRDFEKLIKKVLADKPVVKPKIEQSIELKDMISRMQRVFATKVSALGNDNKGRIYIDYYNRDDLDRIVEILEILEKNKN